MPDDPNELGWNDRIIANFRENGGRVTMLPFQNSNLLLPHLHGRDQRPAADDTARLYTRR
jgi:hypothetical protein